MIAVIAGMQAELAALGPVRADPRIVTAVSGARPDRAEAEARRLVRAGCRVLVSWGVAGGLDPSLAPGTLLKGREILDEAGALVTLDMLDLPGARPACLLGLDRPAMTVADKAGLRRASGADAVDMETHRIARVGAAAGVPAIAIRAVGDPASRALPRLAATALGPDGRPRIGAVLAGLGREPWALPALLRVKRDTDAALASLAAIAPELIGAALAALTRRPPAE